MRSRRRVFGGVCAGIADFVGTRANVVRGIWLFSLLPSLGITALAYPAMWLLLPLEPAPASAEPQRAPSITATGGPANLGARRSEPGRTPRRRRGRPRRD
ncbi:MAG: PspC domain-containing protein [Trueperaceae bacterium]